VILRAALVSAFVALLALPLLGQRLIVTGDEARFAVLAQDMLTRSPRVDARVRDERDRATPPLYPWAIKVLSIPPGRVTETTAQLPVIRAAVASVFFTTLLGQQLFSPGAGIAAGLITATSYGFFVHSQALLPDMLVVAFGMATLCAFWAVGRPLTPVPTVTAFDAWVTRPERPLVVITGRDRQVLDTMRIRAHLMFLVWLAEPGTPRIEGSRAGLALPHPAP
jgi:4-amino-4-deoxy-L-arabinose transferase-like glycosyltransferase